MLILVLGEGELNIFLTPKQIDSIFLDKYVGCYERMLHKISV